MTDESNRFHHPKKPNTCATCSSHVVVLREGECLECYPGLVTPTDTAMEHDWSPESRPDEARTVRTDGGQNRRPVDSRDGQTKHGVAGKSRRVATTFAVSYVGGLVVLAAFVTLYYLLIFDWSAAPPQDWFQIALMTALAPGLPASSVAATEVTK